MKTFEIKVDLFFYRWKQNENRHAEIVEDLNLIQSKRFCAFVFYFKNLETQ